jgi:hypothetical protein
VRVVDVSQVVDGSKGHVWVRSVDVRCVVLPDLMR